MIPAADSRPQGTAPSEYARSSFVVHESARPLWLASRVSETAPHRLASLFQPSRFGDWMDRRVSDWENIAATANEFTTI
jgi:hypothetical protein